MSQAKLEILEMLKEGKITTEEALALLREVPDEEERPPHGPWHGGETCPPPHGPWHGGETCPPPHGPWHGGETSSPPHGPWHGGETSPPPHGPWHGDETCPPPHMPFGMDFGWINELRSSIEESARSFFPDVFPSSQRQETFTASPSFGDNPCSLVFEGKNAPLRLEVYGGENIEVEANYRVRGSGEPHLALMEDNHILTLRYDEDMLHMLGISIRVPETVKMETISLSTKNGPISISNAEAQKIELTTKNQPIDVSHVKGDTLCCATKNSSISLADVRMERVDARTANSSISLRDVEAFRASLVTSNSKINVEDSDIIQLYARTTNSPLRFERLGYRRAGQMRSISAITTNGQISLQAPGPEVKCKLRASTTTNSIFTELDDLEYQVNEKNYVEAQSRGFETAENQLNLNLQTTHLGIYLQK